MDMLSVRYACPFFVLDEFIRLEQLHDFMLEVVKEIYEEKKEKNQWEFYLHKVYGKTYSEFLNSMNDSNNNDEVHVMSEEEINDVINTSRNILDGFIL